MRDQPLPPATRVFQLSLSAFGAAGAIQAGAEAIKHAGEWITIAWTAHGNDDRIAAASKEFLGMLVGIAVAALSALGATANYGNALKIANSMPTGGLPALGVVGGGQIGGAGSATGVLLGPSTGSIGLASNAIAHLVSEPGNMAPGTDEPRLHESLREYLALVVEPNIERMGDEDPDLGAALRALRARVRSVDGKQARALESGIERVLETFYPG